MIISMIDDFSAGTLPTEYRSIVLPMLSIKAATKGLLKCEFKVNEAKKQLKTEEGKREKRNSIRWAHIYLSD